MIQIRRTALSASHTTRRERIDVLWGMQHGKCCYCERKMTTDDPHAPDRRTLEHFRPKGNSLFPELKQEWNNQLLACWQCNERHKADKFPLVSDDSAEPPEVVDIQRLLECSPHVDAKRLPPALLDPTHPTIDPEDHIGFDFQAQENGEYDNIIKARNMSVLGETTIKILKLYIQQYRNKRYQHLNDIVMPRYENLLRAYISGDANEIAHAKYAFQQLMSAKGEFAALVRAFARSERVDQPPINLTIPVGSEV